MTYVKIGKNRKIIRCVRSYLFNELFIPCTLQNDFIKKRFPHILRIYLYNKYLFTYYIHNGKLCFLLCNNYVYQCYMTIIYCKFCRKPVL